MTRLLLEREATKANAGEVARAYPGSVATIDPGRYGGWAIWREKVNRTNAGYLDDGAGVPLLSQWLRKVRPSVIVLERQFLHGRSPNPATTLKLAFEAGVTLGAVTGQLPGVVVVYVHPQTWQAHLKMPRTREGIIEHAEAMARDYLGDRYPESMPKKHREGIDAAICMLAWWRDVRGDV